VIGYEQSEQLDVEPAKYFVLVTKREKRACRFCKEGGVASATLPARIIDKSLASDRVIIDTVVAKYSDHLPLYRQSAMVERESGVEISRATMDGWVMRVGELLSPIATAVGRELVSGPYIQADETPVGVQMHDGEAKTIRRTCGNTADLAAARCSTSGWAAGAKARSGSWGSLKAFCKATAMLLTNKWAGRKLCMPAVGLIRVESTWKR
jgi:transposase